VFFLFIFSTMYSFSEFANLPSVKEVDNIIRKTGDKLEGNCLYQHNRDFKYAMYKDNLRENLYTLCKKSKNILEIGFNAGHSVLLYLYANPKISIRTFDICNHSYSELCANYIRSMPVVDMILFKGDSQVTLPEYNENVLFDLIHIDGGHGVDIAKADLINCKRFSNKNTLLIFDDAQDKQLSILLQQHIDCNLIKEVNYQELGLHKIQNHRVFNYIH